MLSPLEQAVLASCCGCWRRLADLQADLMPEFEPERVPSAVSYLKRTFYLEALGSGLPSGRQFYRLTVTGAIALRRARHEFQLALPPEGASLRLVRS